MFVMRADFLGPVWYEYSIEGIKEGNKRTIDGVRIETTDVPITYGLIFRFKSN